MKKDFKMRTGLIVGQEGLDKLKDANVIVFGVGGVGSFACEALVRAGVGNITIVDFDDVDITNINRQIPALHSTIGRLKVDVMKERLLDINPDLNIKAIKKLYNAETSDEILTEDYDYVVDAIDTVTSKLALAEYCYKNDIKLIASMGTGNKMDPTQFRVTDVFKTKVCPLAKVMRTELRKRGVKKLKVVYSEEIPMVPNKGRAVPSQKRQTPGSISFVPPVAGMIIGGEVIKDLTGLN